MVHVNDVFYVNGGENESTKKHLWYDSALSIYVYNRVVEPLSIATSSLLKKGSSGKANQ
jgi:hypothetical protein